MKRTLTRILCLALCLLMLPLSALADFNYIIPDSNTRKLTREELWQWDYESLGYILNEIFARNGYVFTPGGQYEHYFMNMPWYQPVPSKDNEYCYSVMTATEWANQQLVKDVRAEMRDKHTTNPNGKSLWTNYSAGIDTLSGFTFVQNTAPNQILPVYDAPSYSANRGANGKASVSTNGAIYAAGWENGWLLVMYETNNGSVHVGYVNQNDMPQRLANSTNLEFLYTDAVLLNDQPLTSDPAKNMSSMTTLTAGSHVTYLTSFYNRMAWDYVETTVDGKVTRGFIRSGNLDFGGADEPQH